MTLMRPIKLLSIFCIASMTLLAGCMSTQIPNGLNAVRSFKLAQYEGTWYEIARLDHSFERGLSNVSAHYQSQPNGRVQVINRGFDDKAQKWRQATGNAFFTETPDVASLKVSFFGPFYGGYHVIDLDPNYQWALIVGASRDYFWILSRTPTLNPDLKNKLIQKAQAAGIQTDHLIWVEQNNQPQPN